jgi:hypothetical protein
LQRTNIDVVREGFDRFHERDLDGLLALVHPNVVWLPASQVLEGRDRPYLGHDGVREWYAAASGTDRYLTKLAAPAADEGEWLLWPGIVTFNSETQRVTDSGTLVWYLVEVVDARMRSLRTILGRPVARAAFDAALRRSEP